MIQGSLSHVGYNVRNVEEALEPFLTTGAVVEFTGSMPSGARMAFVRIGDQLVELFEPVDKTELRDAKGPVYDHMAYAVDDLDGLVARLAAAGIQCDPAIPRSSVLGGRTTLFSWPAIGGRIQLMGK